MAEYIPPHEFVAMMREKYSDILPKTVRSDAPLLGPLPVYPTSEAPTGGVSGRVFADAMRGSSHLPSNVSRALGTGTMEIPDAVRSIASNMTQPPDYKARMREELENNRLLNQRRAMGRTYQGMSTGLYENAWGGGQPGAVPGELPPVPPPPQTEQMQPEMGPIPTPLPGMQPEIRPEGVFGAFRRNEGRGEYGHEGKDLYAPEGTPVHAPFNGIVDAYGYDEQFGSGYWVRILMPGGRDYIFLAHLQGFPPQWEGGAKMGQPVSEGELVGYVGRTGNAEGMDAHLHLGVNYGGRWVDPAAFFPDLRGGW